MDQTPNSADGDPSDAPPSAGGGLSAHSGERLTPDPTQEGRRVRASWPWFVAAALGLHALIVVLLLIIERRPDARLSPPEPIAVEVVAAEPRPQDRRPPEPGAAEKANTPPKAQESAKSEPADSKPREPVSDHAPEPKAEPPAKAKAEPPKPPAAQGKAEPPKPPAPPKPEPGEPEPPKRAAAARAPTPTDAAANAQKTAAAAGGARGAGRPGELSVPQPTASRLPFDLGPPIFRAVAVPLPTEGGDEPMNYKVIVFGMLERVKHFPEAAAQRGASGSSVIEFSLDESGGVENVALARSSGDPDLDAESLAIVTRAAPFPVPPPGGQRAFAAEITFGRPQ